MNKKAKEQKENHENIKAIKEKIAKGEKTTFAERNIVNIYDKRMKAKKRAEEPISEKTATGRAYYRSRIAKKK